MMRGIGKEESLSVRPERIAEVLYGDSLYSVMLQLADVVMGLLRIAETARETGKRPGARQAANREASSVLDLANIVADFAAGLKRGRRSLTLVAR